MITLSFFSDLFAVEGAEEGSTLSFLPYLITAVLIGVVLASVYFTVWRIIDARLSKRLYDAGATAASDGKTLAELGYPVGTFRERMLRFLLRSHACMIYKNISCDVLDEHRLALMKQEGEVSDPRDNVAEETPAIEADDADASTTAAVAAPAQTTEDASAEADTPTPDAVTESEAQAAAPRRQKKLKPRARMKIGPETRFYIQPTRLAYVEAHALKVNAEELWGLGFTIVGAVVAWVCLLALLDPLVGFLLQ